MQHQSPQTPKDAEFSGWLDGSLKRPVFIDRSEGEKLANEKLIYEQAKTEKWNRWLTKVWFASGTAAIGLMVGILIGLGLAAIAGF